MTDLDILARFMGALYIYGGYAALKMMLFDREMDGLLTLLEMKPRHPREGTRRLLLTTGAILTGFSGMALLTLSMWAAPLFVLGLIAQIVWLIWAQIYYRPEDEAEARGRRQTIIAALLYAVVTVFVLRGAQDGSLLPWNAPLPLVALAGLGLAGGIYIFNTKKKMRGSALDDFADPDVDMPVDDREEQPFRQPLRVGLAPDIDGCTIFDADDGRFLDAEEYLPPDLARHVNGWNVRYQLARHLHGSDTSAVFDNAEALHAFREEGEEIAQALRELYGPGNVEGPVYDVELVAQPTSVS